MKKKFCSIIPVCLSFALFCSASTASENLVKNGDFEDGDTYWRGGVSVVFETSEHTNRICKIDVDPEEDIQFYQKIRIHNANPVTVNFRIKASADYKSDSRTGWNIHIGRRGSSRGPLRAGWNEMSLTLADYGEDNTTDLTFKVSPGKSGSLYFDDITVTEYVAFPTEAASADENASVDNEQWSKDKYHLLYDKLGREIEAKIIRMDSTGGNITVQKKGGLDKATVPLTVFESETREYINNWFNIMSFLNEDMLSVNLKIRRNKLTESYNDSSYSVSTTTTFGYYVEMDIKNRSIYSFTNTSLEYVLFSKTKDEEMSIPRTLCDKKTVDFPAKSEVQLETDQMELKHTASESITSAYYREEELDGIMLRLILKIEPDITVTREMIYPEYKAFAWPDNFEWYSKNHVREKLSSRSE